MFVLLVKFFYVFCKKKKEKKSKQCIRPSGQKLSSDGLQLATSLPAHPHKTNKFTYFRHYLCFFAIKQVMHRICLADRKTKKISFWGAK